MAGELERPDPAQLRISDDDRHRVAEVLREAAGEGRIDLDELDQRLEATYAAKTYADLVPITVDLPALPEPLAGGRHRRAAARRPCRRPRPTRARSPSWASASAGASGWCRRSTRPSP